MKLDDLLAEIERDKVDYSKQLKRLKSEGKDTYAIEKVVNKSIDNIVDGIFSFVIFGEPQCGKTELMICLSARLIETTNRLIIILVNDNLRLLGQNTNRFIKSRIMPKPKVLNEFLEGEIYPTRIVLCKKNKADLEKLIKKTKGCDKIILDDEADCASPNGRINKKEKTKINELIEVLLEEDGIYTGITATPARLDLNNTFKNTIDNWIHFESHSKYVGKEVFFPDSYSDIQYKLEFIDEFPDAEQLEYAILSFIVNVAMVNLLKNANDKNYAFLVHTSGYKSDHQDDVGTVRNVFNVLSDQGHNEFNLYLEKLLKIIRKNTTNQKDAYQILKYILVNITNHLVIKVNSDRNISNIDLSEEIPNLFTVPVGGNMVSRGLTISNLLGMYFTRDVKRMQQDTYIQRARMFGNRSDYLEYFQLWIPEKLYLAWRNCFVYHDFAIESIKSGLGAPSWIADEKVFPVSSGSIDKQTINIETNEIAFHKFEIDNKIIKKLKNFKNPFDLLYYLNQKFGNECIPIYVLNFVKKHSKNLNNIQILINELPSINKFSKITTDAPIYYNEIEHRFSIILNLSKQARISYSFLPKKMKYFSKNKNQ